MQTLFHRKPKTNKNAKNIEKMKAADLIMLELGVQWPISIVMTPHNMRAFQFCFRHLVNVKVYRSALAWGGLLLCRDTLISFCSTADLTLLSCCCPKF